MICNGNRTEWSLIRSVIIQVITKDVRRASDLFITGMITDLVPINHKDYTRKEE